MDPVEPEIEFRWKEDLVYWEGDRGFVFDGAWGSDPLQTFVPTEAAWDLVVPHWLAGRRREVMERLAAEPAHVVRPDPDFRAAPERELHR
ncbi:MAG TPA: hypothetical protein VNS19_21915 [Acidimicrobiales bacterium]|nr:hypothetical protein [Acidimicrobiales bacterium]